MKLKYKIEDIPPEGLELAVDIPLEQARDRMAGAGVQGVKPAGPVTGRLSVQPVGERVVVKGRLNAALDGECSRCLAEIRTPVDEEVLVVYAYPRETGGDEDEDNQEPIVDGEIDLWPALEEVLVMAVPMKPLCRDDCRGICPTCGKDLNAGACDCHPAEGHPGFAALGKLKDKLPDGE